MFVPLASRASMSTRLQRRKGGGGKSSSAGKSTGSSSTFSTKGSGSSSSKAPAASGSSKGKTVPLAISTASGKTSAVAYGRGGGSTIVISAGQMFAGRSAGGGIRSQIYGTRVYGSGYPGITQRGVTGRGFPFWFWPIVWTGPGAPLNSYLQAPEYGNPYNTSRVGGPMAEATFISNSTNTTFHVISDNSTVSSLIASIDANCSSSLSSSSSTSPQAYDASAPGAPQPQQAIQYYRASSVVLTLDGYNNSATLSSDASSTDSPLPPGIDVMLLSCLNQTIALSAPLVNGAGAWRTTGPSSPLLLCIFCFVWWIIFI